MKLFHVEHSEWFIFCLINKLKRKWKNPLNKNKIAILYQKWPMFHVEHYIYFKFVRFLYLRQYLSWYQLFHVEHFLNRCYANILFYYNQKIAGTLISVVYFLNCSTWNIINTRSNSKIIEDIFTRYLFSGIVPRGTIVLFEESCF